MTGRKRSTTTADWPFTEQKRSRHNDPSASPPPNAASCAAANLRSVTRDSYTVGWICALEVELAASMAMLDEEFAKLPHDNSDPNTYTLGRMEQHNIVLTCLPAGTKGTNAAAIAATNMLRSFPKICVGLMVGIGGGAPKIPSDDPREDIRLGDIVVSCPSANYGGVLQYDFGKMMSEGQFIQTGSLSKTSIVLSNSVSTLRARHRIKESSIPHYIGKMFQLNAKMKENFNHPGVECDQLFRADYDHLNEEPNCRSCDRGALLPRKSRKNNDPIIHYGLIGSANQVMKHGATREKLRKEKNILCFEMEAAGLMDILPCLVVRGICDYADSHKDKTWQPYAAAVAAACAKEILSATPPAEVPTKSTFSGIAIYHMLQATVDEPNLNQLLNALSAVEQEHHISAIPRLDCNDPMFHWVFRNIDFKQWDFGGDHSVLCLTSVPERNICQLSSYFVDQEKKSGHSVVPIFCSAILQGKLIEDRSSITVFIHTILKQLIRCLPMKKMVLVLQSYFHLLLEKSLENKGYLGWKEEQFNEEIFLKYMKIVMENATMNDFLRTMKKALDFEGQRRLLVVVDGLNIIHSADELFICICSLVKHLQQRNSNIKVLLTGRPTAEITQYFREFLHIDHDKERKECLRSLQFHNTRYDKISQEHKGSLEWIWMHKEYRNWSDSETSRLLYIQGKPGSGKSTIAKYFNCNLLQRELSAQSAIVARFFYSFREGELQTSHYNMLLSIIYDIIQQEEAFFYHQCQTEYRAHHRYGSQFKWDYGSLKRILKSLHDYSTTNRFYLIIDAVDESQETDRRDILSLLLELCAEMKYSAVKVFIASRPVAQLEARRDQFHNIIRLEDETRHDIYNFAHSLLHGLKLTHLLARATAYILENAQGVFLWVKLISEELIRSYEEGYSEEEVFEFLQQLPTELGDFYARMLEKMKENKLSLSHGTKMFRLVFFAKRPLTVDELLHAHGISDSFDLDSKYIPSDISLEKCIPSSERFIISCGGNFLDVKGQDGNRTVQIMHQTVREFFLDPDGPVANSEFWIPETHAHTCIAIICIRYLTICATSTSLLGRLPKIDSWALKEYKDYVQYLDKRPLAFYALCHIKSHIDSCRQDANVEYAVSQFIGNLTNDPGASLLKGWASSQLYQNPLSNTQGIIAKNFKEEILRTAAKYGLTTAAEVVISTGTDLEKKDKYGRTPLLWAAINGHTAIVKSLLDRGAIMEAKDAVGQTSLLGAAGNGHLTIVKLLLEKGAVISAEDHSRSTSLLYATNNGDLATVRLLLEKGAAIDAMDIYGRASLSWAAENGHLDIVKLLLERDAVIDVKDINGRTSLSWAAENGHLDIMKLLSERDAVIDEEDIDGRTSLSWAAENGHLAIVELLLERGAAIDEKDNNGRTSLSWAAENGHLAIVELLLKRGAAIDEKDNNGRTSLLWAAENGHLAIVELLLERGAAINEKDDYGRTSLLQGAKNGHLAIAQLLFEEGAVNDFGW